MVAMSVWPTDGADGSVANEARWRKMGRVFAPDGVAVGIANEMAPTLALPNLTIAAGAVWVDGHYAEIESAQVLTATANGLAVVRFDPAANTAELVWRDGVSTPNQNPDGVWELPLYKTLGGVGTDLRVFSHIQAQGIPSFPSVAVRNQKIPQPVLNQASLIDTRPGVIQTWRNSAWLDTTPLIQTGNQVYTTNAGGHLTVTFPNGFGSPPVTVLSVGMEYAALPGAVATIQTNTQSGWQLFMTNGAPLINAVVRVHWIAVGAYP